MGKRMKVLFLRGKVDNRTEEVRSLDESSDMWLHLAFALSDDVEVWYWGGEREHQYASGMVERWIPDFKRSKLPDYRPDVIVCRGASPSTSMSSGASQEPYMCTTGLVRGSCQTGSMTFA